MHIQILGLLIVYSAGSMTQNHKVHIWSRVFKATYIVESLNIHYAIDCDKK